MQQVLGGMRQPDGSWTFPSLDGAGKDLSPWDPWLDVRALLANGVPEPKFLDEDKLLPERARVIGVGPAESGKSLWALWTASELSKAGIDVAYFSEENPLTEDLRRLGRLGPDLEHLRFGNGGVALVPDMVRPIADQVEGCALVVFDTLSACWSGDENDNAQITALDREVLVPLIEATGATVLVLDHTGNPQPNVRRRGVSAPRGASAKGQKFDSLLEFQATGDGSFTITHGKARVGGRKQRPLSCSVIDQDDGSMTIVTEVASRAEQASSVAEKALGLLDADGISTKRLRERIRTELKVGTNTASQAVDILRDDERVATHREGPATMWRGA
ncbi:MAG: AAA family ATPase [Actinomycetota bacterium]